MRVNAFIGGPVDPAAALLSFLVVAVLVSWVAADAARRGRNWFAWAVLVAGLGILGVLAWLVVRRRSPIVVERLGWRLGLATRLVAIPLMVLTFIITTFIVTFLFQAARVEGRAMEPTLADQDRLVVNKFVYRRSDPRRGDIVMLYYPNRPEKTFVKRVIGEESDMVRIDDGRVYVNDVLMNDSFVAADFRSHDDWGPQVVPEGQLLVLGDNRDNSRDSRYWGFLPADQVKGRALLVYWSYEATREEYHRTGLVEWVKDTLSAFGRTRWKRFFHVIR